MSKEQQVSLVIFLSVVAAGFNKSGLNPNSTTLRMKFLAPRLRRLLDPLTPASKVHCEHRQILFQVANPDESFAVSIPRQDHDDRISWNRNYREPVVSKCYGDTLGVHSVSVRHRNRQCKRHVTSSTSSRKYRVGLFLTGRSNSTLLALLAHNLQNVAQRFSSDRRPHHQAVTHPPMR